MKSYARPALQCLQQCKTYFKNDKTQSLRKQRETIQKTSYHLYYFHGAYNLFNLQPLWYRQTNKISAYQFKKDSYSNKVAAEINNRPLPHNFPNLPPTTKLRKKSKRRNEHLPPVFGNHKEVSTKEV